MAKSHNRFLNDIFDEKWQVKLSYILYEKDKQRMVQEPKPGSEHILEQCVAALGSCPCLVTRTASVVRVVSSSQYCQ